MDAPAYLFIAGGIGVTPLLPMIRKVEAQGLTWRLLYGGRTLASMAFTAELAELGGDHVTLRPQDVHGLLDLPTALSSAPAGTSVYACGPEPLLIALEQACKDFPSLTLRTEQFTLPRQTQTEGPDEAFEVELARSGKTIKVSTKETLLDTLDRAGAAPASSCREGTCGTTVLDGTPDRRDSLLTEDEQAAGDVMFPCISRARSPKLVLDPLTVPSSATAIRRAYKRDSQISVTIRASLCLCALVEWTPGSRVGGWDARYRLDKPLGEGGMGEVWLAHDLEESRDVALKRINPGLAVGNLRAYVERLEREARVVSQLRHRNIISVYDSCTFEKIQMPSGEEFFGDKLPCISMEYVEGGDTLAVFAGLLSVQQAARVGAQIASALAAVHEVSIVHRDVKPTNVLLRHGNMGQVLLADFGIALIKGETTETGLRTGIGTPGYMAPEQSRGGRIGTSADLWALGATLYCALTGSPPSPDAVARMRRTGRISESPSARPLVPVLCDLMLPNPALRPTAAEAEETLLDFAEGKTASRRTRPDETKAEETEADTTEADEADETETDDYDETREELADAYPYRPRRIRWKRWGALLVALYFAAQWFLDNTETLKPVGIFATTDEMSLLSVSGDGKLLAAAHGKTVELFDVSTRQPLVPRIPVRAEVSALAFGSGSSTLATATKSQTPELRIWDTASRSARSEPLTGHTGRVNALVFSPDGRTLASASDDGTIQLRDLTNLSYVTLKTGAGKITTLAFSPDGLTLASGGQDGTIRLWSTVENTALGGPMIVPGSRILSPVTALTYAHKGQFIASGSMDGAVHLWRPGEGTEPLRRLSGLIRPVTALAFSSNDSSITAFAGGDLYRWEPTTGDTVDPPLRLPSPLEDLGTLTPNASTLITQGTDLALYRP